MSNLSGASLGTSELGVGWVIFKSAHGDVSGVGMERMMNSESAVSARQGLSQKSCRGSVRAVVSLLGNRGFVNSHGDRSVSSCPVCGDGQFLF